MPQGPGIHKSEELFDQLVKDGFLVIERVHENVYPEYRYRLTKKADELAHYARATVDILYKFPFSKRDEKGELMGEELEVPGDRL